MPSLLNYKHMEIEQFYREDNANKFNEILEENADKSNEISYL